jgi:uncharacterized membrane protein
MEMTKGRMEAFSDGVIAVIITIMVLELRPPHGGDLQSLKAVLPGFTAYVLSFVYVGIYWSNHHHLLQAAQRVNGPILWANLHLLFWLSLTPFTTAWMGQNLFAPWPTALYGMALFLAAVAYTLLVRALIAHHGKGSVLSTAIGRDLKGRSSLLMYACAIPLAFFYAGISYGLFILVAVMWLVPDQRIEKTLTKSGTENG